LGSHIANVEAAHCFLYVSGTRDYLTERQLHRRRSAASVLGDELSWYIDRKRDLD
jgi:hypothetical protein